ncbi:MAG: DUF2510 domain-containing protein [Propionibacteriaceae bacterium]|nr:DUF2510 domain-containing protein [Propionibacteriaceae bacterium]
MAVAAVLVAVSLVIWLGLRPSTRQPAPADSRSASPTVPSWDEQQPSGTPPPIVAPDGGTLIDCPRHDTSPHNLYPKDGWLHGGGLKVKEIPGWKHEWVPMGWVFDMSAQTDLVRSSRSTRWFSMLGVGALHVADGFESPHVSAFQVMSCFATSRFYSGYVGRSDLLSEAVTVNGHPGWRLRSEVRVNMPEFPDVKGDWINVIVVDTGSPESLGVLIASVTIDDHARADLMEQALESLTTR